jgi:hypothetical protein
LKGPPLYQESLGGRKLKSRTGKKSRKKKPNRRFFTGVDGVDGVDGLDGDVRSMGKVEVPAGVKSPSMMITMLMVWAHSKK